MSRNHMARPWRRAAKFAATAAVAATAVVGVAACGGSSSSSSSGGSSSGKVTLKFSQWWAPEMPKGDLQAIVNGFEKKYPNVQIKLISAPFATVQQQTVSDAATGTMADVVGLDGAWVNPLVKQGALLNLTQAMKEAGYDDSDLASQVKLNGSTYMIPVVNFVYPLFTNTAILKQAGIASPPTTWSQFTADAIKISKLNSNVKGWVVPLGTENPNGVENDIMSWVWASGGSMLKNGEPNLTNNPTVTGAVNMVKQLIADNAVLPGADSLEEIDKEENFVNGRVGMMIDSMAHITTIAQGNPKLKFKVSAEPVQDGYTGKHGILTASWGIGISAKTKYPKQAWEFVQYLMSQSVNAQLATEADSFPGNKTSVPDFSKSDPHFQDAFKIYQKSTPMEEFTGLPNADQLMTEFLNQLQESVKGSESTAQMLANVQSSWKQQF